MTKYSCNVRGIGGTRKHSRETWLARLAANMAATMAGKNDQNRGVRGAAKGASRPACCPHAVLNKLGPSTIRNTGTWADKRSPKLATHLRHGKTCAECHNTLVTHAGTKHTDA